MAEPRYVDNPFEEDDLWKDHRNASKRDILEQAFDVTWRTSKRFQSEAEFRRWEKAAKLDDDWLYELIDWAEQKNERVVAIKMPQLLSAMLNKARYDDWLSRQEEEDDHTSAIFR